MNAKDVWLVSVLSALYLNIVGSRAPRRAMGLLLSRPPLWPP